MTIATTTPVQSALNLVITLQPGLQAGIDEAGPALMGGITKAAEEIGTLHDARVVALGDSRVGLLTTYDGDFDTYMTDFTKVAGPMFDGLLGRCVDAPPLPVAKNVDEFLAWVRAHDLPSIHGIYSAYPTLTVQDIRALAAKAGVPVGENLSAGGTPVMSPLNLVMTLKPGVGPGVQSAGPALMAKMLTASDQIGTLHDARFVLLDQSTASLFTIYDGDFETYIADFVKYMGDIFDALLPHMVDAPALPVEKNAQEFLEWVRARDLPSIHGFYCAYPNLTVQDIRALAARVEGA